MVEAKSNRASSGKVMTKERASPPTNNIQASSLDLPEVAPAPVLEERARRERSDSPPPSPSLKKLRTNPASPTTQEGNFVDGGKDMSNAFGVEGAVEPPVSVEGSILEKHLDLERPRGEDGAEDEARSLLLEDNGQDNVQAGPSTPTTQKNNQLLSSPISLTSPSSSSPTSSPRSSPHRQEHEEPQQQQQQHSPTHQNPSRRVKVYRLNEDQWIDLGTGNCSVRFIEPSSAPSPNFQISSSSTGGSEASTSNIPSMRPPPPIEEEGAWILVRRENTEDPGEKTGHSEGEEEEILLRSRVQPYPPGYLSDDEEEEYEDEEQNPSTTDEAEGHGGRRRKMRNMDAGGYQRQQQTLIVWTERETGHEMALSFATSSGCGEIWEFIKAARKWSEQTLASPSLSPSHSSPQSYPSFHLSSSAPRLPEPSLGNLDQIEVAIRQLGRSAVGRERTASMINKGGFIQKLIEVHEEAEDLESLEDLHSLCRVMQTILLLNDNSIFDLILRDEIILGVASILEYDPEFPTMKASYRAHLADSSHFTQVIPIQSPTLLAKIHQTHRLHYLKDVVLARILEDSTFSMLNSAIYFNEVDIVNEIASDAGFLRELFSIFDDEEPSSASDTQKGKEKEVPEKPMIGPQRPPSSPPLSTPPSINMEEDSNISATSNHLSNSTPTTSSFPNNRRHSLPGHSPKPDRKHDAILFLQQFTSMAKNLQIPQRALFFRSLADRGLLRVLEVALSRTVTREDPLMRSATIAILMMLVDHDPNNVRGYSLKQHSAGKRPLVVFLIDLFQKEDDLGLKAQMSEALRVLVDAGGEGGPLEAPPRMRQEDPEAEKFLQYFYDHCIMALLQPILNLPGPDVTRSTLDLPLADVALCGHLCDLLCFFVSHHSFRSKYFVLSSPIAPKVARLFKTRHKHLRLAALRFFRSCVARNDDFYNRFLIKHDSFKPILEIAIEERAHDNLLGSATLELFEYIRTTNAKAIINHLLERYGEKVRDMSTTLKTFSALHLKWLQNNEPPPPPESTGSTATGPTSKSMTREGSSTWARMETEEEESYFNGSDEEEEIGPQPLQASPSSDLANGNLSRKREAGDSDQDSNTDSERKRSKLGAASVTESSRAWTSPLSNGGGLVDYGDDEEDEKAVEEEEKDKAKSMNSGGAEAETADELPGGFIRATGLAGQSSWKVINGIPDNIEQGRDGENPVIGNRTGEKVVQLPSPPEQESEFKIGEIRRKEDNDDDDGELGLLVNSNKTKRVAEGHNTSSPPSLGKIVSGSGAIKFAFGGAKKGSMLARNTPSVNNDKSGNVHRE